MVAGATFVNFGNYVYHLAMARMLRPADYGALSSLIAILNLLTIPSLALITVVVKFTTIYKARSEFSKLYTMFRSFSEKILVLGLLVLLFFILAKNQIAGFLNISEATAVVIVGSFFVFSLLTTVNNGILQGLLNFNFLSINNAFSTVLKVAFSILLVWMGFSVNGAVIAVLIAYVLPYLTSLFPLRFLRSHKSEKIKIDRREILNYAAPATLAILGVTSLYSMDIILVKHFFPPFQAGLYAALSIVGKIIFFASNVIGIVMFPIISEKFEKREKYKTVLYESIILVASTSFLLAILYFLWPEIMMKLLYGSSYLRAASYLGIFGIFMSIFSMDNLFLQFFLSVRETRVSFLAFGAALLQGVLIWFYHDNFQEVIYSSIIATSLLFASLLIYYICRNSSCELANKNDR